MKRHPYRSEPTNPLPWLIPAWLEHFWWWCRQPITGRWLLPFCMISMVASASMMACTDASLQIQAQTANAVAQAANSGLPILVERFRAQGFTALERVKAEGGTEADARAAVAKVEADWEPIWKAWDMLQVAQDKWATVIESGGDTAVALSELKDAYCQLRSVWPQGIPAVPLAPLRCAQ